MALDPESADRLFDKGLFADLIKLASYRSGSQKKLEPRLRVTLAHALALTGDIETAAMLARFDTGPDTSPSLRSRAESVLGIVSERRGAIDEAYMHFRSSERSATEAKDVVRLAWARLYEFRLLVEGYPRESLMAMLPDLRKAVLRAGTPQTNAYLHACVAIFEGQTGRTLETIRHCDAADAVLEQTNNSWLQAINLSNRACAAWLSSRLSDAADYLRQARHQADKSGHSRMLEAIEGNLGHLEMITGQFDKARRTYARILKSSNTGGTPAISVLEGTARVALAERNLAACEEALEKLEHLASPTSLSIPYHVRWSAITRSRLLTHRGQLDKALSVLVSLRAQTKAIHDELLNRSICLTSAQILTQLGRPKEAATELLNASLAGPEQLRIKGQDLDYASALCMEAGPLSSRLRNRALRTWGEESLLSLRLEMDGSVSDVAAAREEMHGARSSQPPAATSAECVADAVAAALDLAHSPRLLGAELLSLVRGLDCSPDAKVVETRLGEPRGGPGALTLPLGTADRKAVTLVCAPPATPRNAVLLGDVFRIGRSAVALEAARAAERSRAALWPASPVEEQAGALFLAEEMQVLLATARRIASSPVPILLTGETGTGKEVLARTIHGYSPRAGKTFLPFNCTATPREMLDAQLFGHRRGAFTGATDHFPGIIRAAAGGTLFLDEIGETTLDVQPKLLRFLEAGEVHPIGDTHPAHVDVRVIAATNADLDALVAQGRFREDLFYRLNIIRLHIPPLRERTVEIPPLANHYLQKFAAESGKKDLRIAEETMEYLVLYPWPGNVRQLANEMRRMATLAEDGAVLMPEHLSRDIAASRRTLPPADRTLQPTEIVVRIDQPLPAAIQHLERAMIQFAMSQCDGGVEDAAALLGISRKGLYLKRQRFGMVAPQEGAGAA